MSISDRLSQELIAAAESRATLAERSRLLGKVRAIAEQLHTAGSNMKEQARQYEARPHNSHTTSNVLYELRIYSKLVIDKSGELLAEALADASVEAGTPDEPSVMGAGNGPAPMPTKAEAEAAWRTAYVARMVERGVHVEDAQACCAVEDLVLSQSPAEAADAQLEYWQSDEADAGNKET